MASSQSIAQKFIRFSEAECKETSPLYEYLSLRIANDEEILQLANHTAQGQPIPNLLFGAVHYLLLKEKEHALKEFYPSLVSNVKLYDKAFPAFKDFCLTYQQEIVEILGSRLVQTNEVRRNAYLYPAFCMAYEIAQKPLALIEIGTSSGLQLLWDIYSYSYGDKNRYGNLDSDLHITSEIIGENIPVLHVDAPPITTRIGIDLNIVDVNNHDEKLWLKALIWPEHKERLFMLEKAANYIRDANIQFYEGNGVHLLPNIVKNIVKDYVICIFHTHVANQMPSEVKVKLLKTVEVIGKEREVFHIYNNIYDKYLHLDYYLDGKVSENTIAETEGHGRWFKWLLKNSL